MLVEAFPVFFRSNEGPARLYVSRPGPAGGGTCTAGVAFSKNFRNSFQLKMECATSSELLVLLFLNCTVHVLLC